MFDPHNHIGGIVPYRVLALLAGPTGGDDTMSGEDIFRAAHSKLADEIGSSIECELTRERFESYLAHHELIDDDGVAVKVQTSRTRGDVAPVWASPVAYGPEAKTKTVQSDALAKLELVLVGRLFSLVHRTLMSARTLMSTGHGSWERKRQRLTTDASSKILDPLIDVMGRTSVPWPAWLENPKDAPLDAAKPIKHLLQNALTSTPVTDYDTAYAFRGFLLKDEPLGKAPLTHEVLLEASLNELRRQGITYAEVSAGDDEFEHFKELPPEYPVQIGWLVAIPNDLVTGFDGDAFLGAVNRMTAAVRERSDIVGFSMLAPEGVYESKSELKSRIPKLLEQLAAVGDHRPYVAHFHVGEGTARWQGIKLPDIESALTGKRALQKPRLDLEATKHEHDVATSNVRAVLEALDPCEWPEHVHVRLGHVTHAQPAQAEEMKRQEVWADVNLTSNVATSVWNVDAAEIDVKRVAKERYDGHAVHALIEAGVPFALGTDGSGVEHSTMMVEHALMARIDARGATLAKEYARAHEDRMVSSLHTKQSVLVK